MPISQFTMGLHLSLYSLSNVSFCPFTNQGFHKVICNTSEPSTPLDGVLPVTVQQISLHTYGCMSSHISGCTISPVEICNVASCPPGCTVLSISYNLQTVVSATSTPLSVNAPSKGITSVHFSQASSTTSPTLGANFVKGVLYSSCCLYTHASA